MYRTGSTKLLI